ncbi:coproporphyrinogen dehydrogenase HemZ [Eubacterium oxidoreducens]|uniref:Oxygen-independent coproporphyrinogen-3 oxidase n=1 Tax=Eubacterium oxidoreducens TaxID=1732 RepID=A0A1G6AG01_EUBOX|nr:coproporphyrinogen dehydrogenase HemZ [Eubacterium oxidoreducens]SDB07023.1 oxygen-independent coproporphyrinogen-3 oxidase [Eubacterium oxidoreducens]
MIYIQVNTDEYEYDIHSLVKAFYPKERVIFQKKQARPGEVISFSLAIRILSDSLIVEKEKYPIDTANRSVARNTIKKALYRYLSERTGQTLPWGTLTGVRPTKRPMEVLLDGGTGVLAIEDMVNMYYTSKEKASLATRVAAREICVLNQLPLERSYSLYIGIPFCPTRCLYCSFTSYPVAAWQDEIERYLDCLEKELRYIAHRMKEFRLLTIYMGGGTPTTLSARQLDRVLRVVEDAFDLGSVVEICVEAGRADSITKEKLQTLKAHGVNRISINPQTMQQKTLDLIGRKHTVEQVVESFQLARQMGFDDINMDLIVGLMDETMEDVADTLRRIRELKPEGLTVHSLAIKRASELNIQKEEYENLTSYNSEKIMQMTMESAGQMGLWPYYMYRQKNMTGNMENVGYCSEGHEGIYNILMMEDVHSILAAGAGAISKMILGEGKIKRAANVKDVRTYLDRIDDMIEKKANVINQLMEVCNMEE